MVKTITEARANLYALVEEVCEQHEEVEIRGKRGSAVLVSLEDWRAIQETVYLLSVPGMRESIRKGLRTPIRKCVGKLKW
jgi:prevent-host-death family protein